MKETVLRVVSILEDMTESLRNIVSILKAHDDRIKKIETRVFTESRK